jgi:hypothetical protein
MLYNFITFLEWTHKYNQMEKMKEFQNAKDLIEL